MYSNVYRRIQVKRHVNKFTIGFSKPFVFSVIIIFPFVSLRGRDTMVTENDEMVIGWPLGLSFLSMRLRVVESLQENSVEPYQLHIPSTSFSSFSTSNLDTESTTSFFQDNSVSLAQLIGFRSGGDRGRLYFPNSLRFEERNKELEKGCCSHESKEQGRDMSRVICIPLLVDTLFMFRKSKKSSRN